MADLWTSVTRERLDRIIAANTEAPHLNIVFEAVRDYGVRLLTVVQIAVPFADALDDTTRPFIAIVGDDTERSFGPGAFHRASLERVVRMADGAAVISSASPLEVYAGLAALAAFQRSNVVIVETRPEQEIAWVNFIEETVPGLPILLATVQTARA